MKKRCTIPPSSSSSSSSSSCIESPITEKIVSQKSLIPPKIKPIKRVRAKKIVNAAENSATSPKSRSSIYRGVTRHRWTGRYEAHLWDKSTWNSIQNKRGRQIYLGAYDNEDDAARTYDLAALKYWGPTTVLNFPLDTYTKDLEEMENLTKEEFLAILRRRSSGFSRGVSKYRGVARHHHNGRWEARIGRVTGNKYLYLGTYNTQEEAAAAYDMAAIEFRGPNAVTNFDISHYAEKLKQILPDMQVKEEESQVKKEVIPDSSNLAQPDEPHDHDHDQQHDENQVQSSIPKLESIDSIDSQSMVMMDPTEAHEHPWDLCLDIGFNMLPIPDIPLESDFYGLFDEKGFVDDIELIFRKYSSEVAQDAISGTDGYKMEADILPSRELKEMKVTDVSDSPSSSSLSTMASVCSSG